MSPIPSSTLLLSLLLSLFVGVGSAQLPTSDFQLLVSRIVQNRLNSAESDFSFENQALAQLDTLILRGLNSSPPVSVQALNHQLKAMVSQLPPVGESYRLLRINGPSEPYALLVNFSLSGPSAVRLYALVNNAYALVARIDAATQPDFLDEYLEIVPLKISDASVFVTVSGRTDGLSTGVFRAWKLESGKVETLWSSDLLEQSFYSSEGNQFQVEFCSETQASDPRVCQHRSQFRFAWQESQWKKLEGPPAPAPR